MVVSRFRMADYNSVITSVPQFPRVETLASVLFFRHAGAASALARLPEAHFAVQAVVHTLKGDAGRNADEYRTALKNATAELEEAQGLITKQLSEVLRHGLTQ